MARARKASAGGGSARRVKQVLVAAAVVAALVFAVQGGEFGTRDLMRQYKQRVETDPALQERIAREEFGLVRGNKELLYRIAEPVTAPRAP